MPLETPALQDGGGTRPQLVEHSGEARAVRPQPPAVGHGERAILERDEPGVREGLDVAGVELRRKLGR